VRRLALAVFLLAGVGGRSGAQETQEPPEVGRAYDLENAGKYREAAALFRSALRTTPTAGAVLGLERM
jgi:hypothetical protein